MRKLTTNEISFIIAVLFLVFTLSWVNLNNALRRTRDLQRRSDAKYIGEALDKYRADNGFYPPASVGGKISGCLTNETSQKVLITDGLSQTELFELFDPCDWGQEALKSVLNGKNITYMDTIPLDPRTGQGLSYLYISTISNFQLYVHLEDDDDAEQYQREVANRNLYCGDKICNFGVASAGAPIDRTLEEYEAELERLRKEKSN